jgi:DNA (cytosine-5)-methyltransferase 1
MRSWYNEIDPFCAEWLRNLIVAGHIADGDVDERDIRDVRATDLTGYRQCHFFAGIGIWSAALRAEGWPDDRQIWTGSCPCQPVSSAGKRQGHADERHLWPAFHALIAECKPAIVVGEQVASKDGREWLSAVRADLEAAGYAVGAADLCAAGAGAPHIRQRLYWMADDSDAGLSHAEPQDLCGARGWQEGRAVAECGPSSSWEWVMCTDGKTRPAQPGIFPLVDAWPQGNRVAVLRAAGNALHLETARQFIGAIHGGHGE